MAKEYTRTRIEYKCKKGKIVRFQRINSISVDYFVLFDKDGNYVEESMDFNRLMKKLTA